MLGFPRELAPHVVNVEAVGSDTPLKFSWHHRAGGNAASAAKPGVVARTTATNVTAASTTAASVTVESMSVVESKAFMEPSSAGPSPNATSAGSL